MTGIIEKDEVDKLKFVLNYVADKQYIDCVQDLQNHLIENFEQGEAPVIHHFAPHVYMRQMDAAAGSLVVSKMHKTEHMNILLKGSLTILTEDGIQHLQAPAVLKSKAGTKRIGYFHEDSSWITVHPTDETDLTAIEKQVIVPQEQEKTFLENIGVLKCLGQ